MNKFRLSLISAVVLTVGSPFAIAQQADIYLGTGVGVGHIHGLNHIEGMQSSVDDAAAANLFLGYDFNEYLSVEGGYLYVGKGKSDELPFQNHGATLSLNGRVPIVGDLSLIAEAGAYWATTEGLGEKDRKVSPMLGAGLSYQINEQFDVQARWRYIKDVADIQSERYQTRFEPNENFGMIELVYHPFRSTKSELIQVVSPEPTTPTPDEPETMLVDKPFELSTEIHFNLNQTSLDGKSLQALENLQDQLSEMSSKKQIDAVVIGYSDSLGASLIRDRVAKERAEAVANYLVHIGVPESQIHVQANTISDSTCSDVTNKEEQVTCLAPNRRVDIKITGYQEVEELASPW
ncbi:outer membrane beta-barrel protein [Vibrio cholerae]|uniref:outer membrane beta-barrel protein n=1 Tax=Vibrio cholerae TaxID=666 RepID=UPI003016A8CB